MDNLSFQPHNHRRCKSSAIKQAEMICRSQGERLTSLRKTVLEFVWSSHQPVKAYELLAKLQAVHPSSAPPTVYRALDFLQGLGLVHKIESLNAYLGCPDPAVAHTQQFLICQSCGLVAELADDAVDAKIKKAAEANEFEFEAMSLEVHGRCNQCRDSNN